jgi:hypothetical protein
MNVEELRATAKTIGTPSGNYKYIPMMVLEDFLSSHICIPQGGKRHPYADILHALAEDSTLEVQLCYGWEQWTKPTGLYEASFRIKPQEPVYEWQWYRILDGEIVILQEDNKKFYSDIEAEERWSNLFKVEGTKRIRK